MCGLFGWVGKDPKDFNKDKFDKLGIYNVNRGKDSCGISYDGDIYTGVNSNKLYYEFIIGEEINPIQFPVVIGHTRQASIGNIVNSDNAHPFGFDTNKFGEGFKFIGAHNGTLYNSKELANKYNIDDKVVKETKLATGAKSVTTRTKIDSEILLEILYKSGNYNVLSEYVGAAALLFTDTDEPNVLYVWKGASSLYNTTKTINEERPLFYYKENKNSLYVSSIEKSLLSIGGKKDESVFTFEENTVYKITDGDIDNAEKITISRDNAFQKETSSYNSYYGDCDGYGGYGGYYGRDVDDYYSSNRYSNYSKNGTTSTNYPSKKEEVVNIYNEGLLRNQNDYKGRVYFNKLRYWKNGHLITGVFSWIEGYGFYKLGEVALENIPNILKCYINKIFIDGAFIIKDEEFDKTNPKIAELIPFKTYEECENNLHYFIQGVNILTKLDYVMLYQQNIENINKNKNIDIDTLSEASTHPIIDLKYTTKGPNIQWITHKKDWKVTDTICPLGSEKIYYISNGNLIKKTVNPIGEKSLFGTFSIKTEEELRDTLVKNDRQLPIPFKREVVLDPEIVVDAVEDPDADFELTVDDVDQAIDEVFTEQFAMVDDLLTQLEHFTGGDSAVKDKIERLKLLKDYLSTEI